jgi:hypothetical protein
MIHRRSRGRGLVAASGQLSGCCAGPDLGPSEGDFPVQSGPAFPIPDWEGLKQQIGESTTRPSELQQELISHYILVMHHILVMHLP